MLNVICAENWKNDNGVWAKCLRHVYIRDGHTKDIQIHYLFAMRVQQPIERVTESLLYFALPPLKCYFIQKWHQQISMITIME